MDWIRASKTTGVSKIDRISKNLTVSQEIDRILKRLTASEKLTIIIEKTTLGGPDDPLESP